MDQYNNCIKRMIELHTTCNFSKKKCDILLNNLLSFCERYNSDSNNNSCGSVNNLGGVTLNRIIKSPT